MKSARKVDVARIMEFDGLEFAGWLNRAESWDLVRQSGAEFVGNATLTPDLWEGGEDGELQRHYFF